MASYSSSNDYFNNIRMTRIKLKATLKNIDKCVINSYIESYNPIVKHSASSTLIVLGKLNDEVTSNIDNEDDKKFVIKASFKNIEVYDNSLEIERQIYDNIIGKMLNNNMTPCLIDKITSFECDKNKLQEIYPQLYDDIKNMKKLNSFDTSIIKLLMLEKTNGITIGQFVRKLNLKRYDIDYDEINLVSITFQLLWTLCVFKKLKFKHNDLHFGNIFVETLDEPIYMLFLKNENEYYRLETIYIIKIYDFDRSSIFSYPGIDRNIALDSFFCKYVGQCNYMSSKFDLFSCLQQFNMYIDESTFKNNFLLNCFNINNTQVEINEKYPHLLPFGAVDTNDFIKSPSSCFETLINTNWGDKNPISIVTLTDDEKNNYKNCIFKCPEKINIQLWNPISTNNNKSLNEEFDIIDEDKMSSIHKTMSTNINKLLSNDNIISIWKFELSLIKNFNWYSCEFDLFFTYLKNKDNKIDIKNLSVIIMACKFLSCPIYYKINNDKYMENEFDNYNSIKVYIEDIWNTFNNVLPIKIPLL
jgi:hypothetical protein